MSILLYGCTTWTLTKHIEKNLGGNYTRMLGTILNKSWRQHPTKQQLYNHLPPITKTIQVRRTRYAGLCWRSRDELISHILLWTLSHGRAKAGWPARTYIQQLCADTGCSLEDLPEAMDDKEDWQERVRDIRANGTIWWWWYISSWCLKTMDVEYSLLEYMRFHINLWECLMYGCYYIMPLWIKLRKLTLELWGMRSTSSLPSLLGPGVVASKNGLSIGQIELKCVHMVNWIAWNRTVFHVKLRTYTKLDCLK